MGMEVTTLLHLGPRTGSIAVLEAPSTTLCGWGCLGGQKLGVRSPGVEVVNSSELL